MPDSISDLRKQFYGSNQAELDALKAAIADGKNFAGLVAGEWGGGGGGAAPVWTNFTPSLTQNAVALAHTKEFAEYIEDASGLVTAQGSLTITGTGAAGHIRVGLPVAAALNKVGAPHFGFPIGVGRIRDESSLSVYQAIATITTATEFWFMPANLTGANPLGTAGITALGAGDSITFTISYRKA